MTRGNWERWGAADERGALNWIGPEHVVSAARLVRTGRIYPLAVRLGRDTPTPAERAHPLHFMVRDGGDYAAGGRRPGGFQFSDDAIVLATHTGTHMDALAHCWTDDRLYNGFPGNSIRSTTGAAHCGVDKVGAVVGRGVLLDVAGHLGKPHLETGFEITPDTLAACAEAAGVRVGRGDVVLIRTGWQSASGENGPDAFRGEPGPGLSAARWLTGLEVAAVGADNYAFEVLPPPAGTVFPAHLHLLRDFGTLIFEGLMLEDLACDRIAQFLFVATPLPITGGVGSPVAPVAIV
ncbi:MAG: cyclase family protein [bacterium]